MFLIAYILIIILLYLSELITKKKISKVLPFITSIFFIILMGANTNNPDTEIYLNIYKNKVFFEKDMGFGILVNIFNNFGCDYYVLKMFISIVGIFLINRTLEKYVKDTKLYYLLYFIYPFFMDIVQVRNFLAMSIFVFAIPYLLENTKRGNIKYIITVLIAASMQKVALFYLPIVFIKNIQKNKIIKIVLYFILALVIGTALYRPALNSLINLLLSLGVVDALDGLSGFMEINTNMGWIIKWCMQIGSFVLVAYSKKAYEKHKDYIKEEEYKKIHNFLTLIYNINLYMFITLPLFVLNPTFERIIRNVLPLNFICYSIIVDLFYRSEIINKQNKVLYITIVILFNLSLFCLTFLYNSNTTSSYITTILSPAFQDNWIINIIR